MLTTASSSADTFVEAPNPVASEGAVIWTGARTGRIWKKVDRNGLRKEGELLSISNARSFTSGLQSYWQLTTEEVKGTSTAAAWAEQHTASSSPSQTPIDQSEMGRNPCEERRGAAEETKAAEKANADDEAKRKWMHLGYDDGKKVGVWKKQYWQEDRAEDRHNSQNCEESGIDWAAHSDSESKSVREAGAGTAAEESKAAADPNRTKGFAKAEPDRRCNHWGEQWGRRNWWQKEWQEGFSGWAGDFEWTGHPDSDPDSVRWNFAGSHVQLGSAETASLHAGWQSMEVAQHDEAAAAKMAEPEQEASGSQPDQTRAPRAQPPGQAQQLLATHNRDGLSRSDPCRSPSPPRAPKAVAKPAVSHAGKGLPRGGKASAARPWLVEQPASRFTGARVRQAKFQGPKGSGVAGRIQLGPQPKLGPKPNALHSKSSISLRRAGESVEKKKYTSIVSGLAKPTEKTDKYEACPPKPGEVPQFHEQANGTPLLWNRKPLYWGKHVKNRSCFAQNINSSLEESLKPSNFEEASRAL